MSESQRGERVAELLEELEAVPAGEHEAHLKRLCSDPELRREVLSLLAVESASTGYLDRFVSVVEEVAPPRLAPPDLTDKRIGAYRLLRQLGRGGMGVVYEAERADGAFEQRVALKLLTTALTGTAAHERFLAERRILAGLEHPTIARILDGGVTEDGTPWFAMEHVEGLAVDDYCDRRRLGIDERLQLFLQVCDAVEHAHRCFVVHRDLKPANVMVTEEGQVKLLDFGIARLLAADEERPGAPTTGTAVRLMTPEYASPEQVRGEPVTVASDVYQLGLVLYELLSGHRPYVLRRRSASEIERVICEQTPTRLSTAPFRRETSTPASGAERPARTPPASEVERPTSTDLKRPADHSPRGERHLPAGEKPAIEQICGARHTTPARLRRRLRGDLETIVARALAKEPERRYGSADRLAQDVRRHLDDLPVTARPDTWIYRSRKFLERHAVAATATTLVFLLVAGLTGYYTLSIQRARDRAEAERDRAQAEAVKARQVSEFLAGLFRSADPREARGVDVEARRKLLDQGLKRVDRELAGQPDVRADMLHVLGRTYLELGAFEPAERLLTRALDLHGDQHGPGHSEVADVLYDLGLLRYRAGRYQEARVPLEEARGILAASAGSDPSGLARVYALHGQIHRALAEYEQSLAMSERALELQRRASGEPSEPEASILHTMGAVLFEMGALERAESLYEEALVIYERVFDADHPKIGYLLMDLASARLMRGELTGLEETYRRVLAIQRRAYGPDHAVVGRVLINLGAFLVAAGRNDEAVEVVTRALEILRQAVGPDHPTIAYALTNLGDAHLALRDFREARSNYRESLTFRTRILGERRGEFDPLLAHVLVKLGRVEDELENRAEASELQDRALSLWRQAPETIGTQIAPALHDLVGWLVESGRCADATPLIRRALAEGRARRPVSSAQVAELEGLLASCAAGPAVSGRIGQ